MSRTSMQNETRNSLLRSESSKEVGGCRTFEAERDLLSEEYKNMSEKLEQVSEQLAHKQAESADLIRQNESDQRELAMLRRNLLIGGGGSPILNKMYETMLGRYDELKSHHENLQQTLASESMSRKEIQHKLDSYVKELSEARMRRNNIATDHAALSREFQSLNEMNDSLQRDLHRVREERTMVKREYALVMSERDTVHKEIQKLTDDISVVNRKLVESVSEKKGILDEKERLLVQVNSLKQSQGNQQSTSDTSLLALRDELYVAQRERKQALDQYESQLNEAYTARKAHEHANDNVMKLQSENELLTSKVDALMIELRDANNEAKDATRNRDMAFSEREKMRCERDEIKKTYDQLAEERERIMKQLESEMKEHDVTKETKKRVLKELRELQPRRIGNRGNAPSTGSRRDNTDSHDSAIDAGEWGSEEISTLEGGGVSRRLRTFQYKLPRQPDMNLETGLFVTRSACRGITIGDRVVAINDTIVDSTNASRLQRLVPNSANTCVIKVMRSSSPPPNESQSSHTNNISLNEEYGHQNKSQSSVNNNIHSLNGDYVQSDDSAVFTRQQNAINKGILTVDAECQTSQILRPHRTKNRQSLQNPSEDTVVTGTEDILAPIRNVHHTNSPSVACVSSGGESHQSNSTYSDSTQHSLQASILPRHPSQKSSDSNLSFQRSSSSKREKKKTKTPRFWSKMKKSKSQSSGTDKTSSGGTWPRLESPPLVPFGGHLSIFTKKRSRPTLSSTTFMQPTEPGRTPPMVRGVSTPGDAKQRSFQDIHPGAPPNDQKTTNTVSKIFRNQKRPRPISVPISMSTGQSLSLWDETNISNNNNAQSPRRPQTPRTPALPEDSGTIGSGSISHLSSHDSSSISTNQSERLLLLNEKIKESLSTATTVYPTMTGQPITRPHTIYFEKPGFQRQKSVPPTSGSERMMTLPESIPSRLSSSQLQRARPVTSPINPNLQQPRSARSLPRPTSARPSSSSRTSSHQSIETSIQHKTKSLDCRRIKLSGSEKGSLNLSSDRSTPTLYNNRSHSPATPLLQSPGTAFHSAMTRSHPHSIISPSLITSFSLSATPMFHPSSTPLIPSPATPIPSATSFILDTPIPVFPGSTVSSLSNISTRGRRPPVTTDPRHVRMIKGTDPIGISIVGGGEKGGIFVSRITEDSLAARAGLEYGDQLLEYNGINLRCANEDQGRVIMSQTQPGDNITFLAQYNLEKYKSSIESNLSDSLGFLKATKQQRSSLLTPCEDNEGTMTPGTTPRSSPRIDTIHSQPPGQPRTVFLTDERPRISFIGGNRSGIFIAEIDEDDTTESSNDLKIGDQVLEYNSTDFHNATLERASILLSKSTMNISLRVYFNSVGFSKLSTEPGDFFYVRALFDNIVDASTGNLPFSKNSILLVDNTYPDHAMGSWSAWLVDEHGEKTTHGKIPSKFTVERESGIHREFDDAISCAGSTAGKKHGGTGRRSFFKRRKPHRTSSRSSGDIKLHKSISETSIESTETSFEHSGAAYQVVSKHVCQHRRPVVVFGPHSSTVCDKLTKEFADRFTRCSFEALHSNTDIHDKNIIDSVKQVTCTLALRVDTLMNKMEQQRHVLLELSQEAVDRLHSHKIYPIIVFLEYNSAKKIKESQDRFPGREKISMKQSKEIFERANSMRRRLSTKYLGTVYIHGGSAHTVAKQIHTVVDREQSKVLWLPASHDLLNY